MVDGRPLHQRWRLCGQLQRTGAPFANVCRSCYPNSVLGPLLRANSNSTSLQLCCRMRKSHSVVVKSLRAQLYDWSNSGRTFPYPLASQPSVKIGHLIGFKRMVKMVTVDVSFADQVWRCAGSMCISRLHVFPVDCFVPTASLPSSFTVRGPSRGEWRRNASAVMLGRCSGPRSRTRSHCVVRTGPRTRGRYMSKVWVADVPLWSECSRMIDSMIMLRTCVMRSSRLQNSTIAVELSSQ